jgi:putative ABC transport system ATP-binding protein
MPLPVLEGRGIGKVFGAGDLAVRALHPMDIAVHRGEVVVIMGPSGSGKTTLLSMLGLVLEPTEGEVLVEGASVTRRNPDLLARLRRDKVGFVFQRFNLLSGLTALDNVTLPLLLRGTNSEERCRRARNVLDLVGMGDKAKSRARQLSVGQQQRVAIARALVAEARVLLCDEPTASLDGHSGLVVLETLRRLARAGSNAPWSS